MTKAEKAAKIIADEIKKNIAVLEAKFGYEEMLARCGRILTIDRIAYFSDSPYDGNCKYGRYMTGLALYMYYIERYNEQYVERKDQERLDELFRTACREAGYDQKAVDGLRWGGRKDIRMRVLPKVVEFFDEGFLTDSEAAYRKAWDEKPYKDINYGWD